MGYNQTNMDNNIPKWPELDQNNCKKFVIQVKIDLTGQNQPTNVKIDLIGQNQPINVKIGLIRKNKSIQVKKFL